MPQTAQRGIVLWGLAWTCFLVNIYRLTQDSAWVAKTAIAVGLLVVFLLRGQNWARMIALMTTAMALLFLIFLAIVVRENGGEAAIALLGALLFGLAGFYLSLRVTAGFFKDTGIIEAEGDDQRKKPPHRQ